MNESAELVPIIDGFPRPRWDSISERVFSEPEDTWAAAWGDWSNRWVNSVLDQLPESYRLVETDNFLVVSSENDRYVELLSNFLERSLLRILSSLQGIASDEGYGKHVLLMFSNQELYYQYISHFYPDDGEFILSSGVFLDPGYGHFVFPFLEMSEAEATSAHELTHACLSHLPIPLWLNEGFAVTMEDEICGSAPLHMDNERFSEHASFWDDETIQEFWLGTSFNRTDQGSVLSYELARYCVRALSHDYDAFVAFANSASYLDSGEAAAVEVFGGSLGGLVHQFFGDGNWSPRPELWTTDGNG
ncbi:MAG: hypothetical protein AAGI27_16890 [Pseudomonadota bacterium]